MQPSHKLVLIRIIKIMIGNKHQMQNNASFYKSISENVTYVSATAIFNMD